MPQVIHANPFTGAVMTLVILLLGGGLSLFLANLVGGIANGSLTRHSVTAPFQQAVFLWKQKQTITERPDFVLWVVAPATYAAVAAAALMVVPLAEGFAIADVRTGIVFFGAAEAIAIVAVFLHGWSPNSYLPLMGGYRFVAIGLSYELLSMFVLIAASLPAESLQVSAIVESQAGLWNVVRQPLGLPLWILVTLGVTFQGPFNVVDSRDLSGGTQLETSGRHRLAWQLARHAMMAVFCLMGASIFLGGWLGPFLPGWLWIILKGLLLLILTAWAAAAIPRIPAERSMELLWIVGLPLSFLHLLQAGIVALL